VLLSYRSRPFGGKFWYPTPSRSTTDNVSRIAIEPEISDREPATSEHHLELLLDPVRYQLHAGCHCSLFHNSVACSPRSVT
jgi:hypothetical protein